MPFFKKCVLAISVFVFLVNFALYVTWKKKGFALRQIDILAGWYRHSITALDDKKELQNKLFTMKCHAFITLVTGNIS